MKKLLLLLPFLFSATFLPAQEIKKSVYFDVNSAALNAAAKAEINDVVRQLQSSYYRILLSGHTDSVGSDASNEALSAKRTAAVKAYLLANGVTASAISSENYGETAPAAVNFTEANRALNRRVEIVVAGSEPPPEEAKSSDAPAPVIASAITQTQENGVRITYPPGVAAGSFDVSVINSTQQMEAGNFTTMTTGGEPLASNVIFCIKKPPGTDCILKEPVTVRIPVSKNPFCNPVDVKYYDAKADSASGQVNWSELLPDFKTETINGQLYFVTYITNICIPCKNFDCPKLHLLHGYIVVTTKKYTLTDVKVIYETANALLPGKEQATNHWFVQYFNFNKNNPAKLKMKVTDKNGEAHSVELKLDELKTDADGNFIFKKKVLKKLIQ